MAETHRGEDHLETAENVVRGAEHDASGHRKAGRSGMDPAPRSCDMRACAWLTTVGSPLLDQGGARGANASAVKHATVSPNEQSRHDLPH